MYFDSILDLGDTLCAIGVKESAAANEAFTKFGEYHRQMEKVGIAMLKKTKRVSIFLRNFSNTFGNTTCIEYFYHLRRTLFSCACIYYLVGIRGFGNVSQESHT